MAFMWSGFVFEPSEPSEHDDDGTQVADLLDAAKLCIKPPATEGEQWKAWATPHWAADAVIYSVGATAERALENLKAQLPIALDLARLMACARVGDLLEKVEGDDGRPRLNVVLTEDE